MANGVLALKIFPMERSFTRFIENKKLAARIGVITTIITLIGMTPLWLVVSTNAASMVGQMRSSMSTSWLTSR